MNIIELILLGSAFSMGLSLFSEEGNPFEFVSKMVNWLVDKANWLEPFFKPIILCYICMGWFYSALLFVYFKHTGDHTLSWWTLPVVALCSSTLNRIVGEIIGE